MTGAPLRLLGDYRSDLAFAARTLLRSRGFLVAALSLGVAVGATSAVYSTADWLLDRSAHGVVAPDGLVGLTLTERGRGNDVRYGFSFPQYLALRGSQDAFAEVAAYAKVSRPVRTDSWSAEVVLQFVTGSYFPMLGVRPYIGRLPTPADDIDGTQPLVVLSYELWRSRFAGDRGVVGAPIIVGGTAGRVIGVLPHDFEDYSMDWNGPTQIWLPMLAARSMPGMPGMLTAPITFFQIMGRVAPGVSPAGVGERAQRWMADLPPVRSAFDLNAVRVDPEREMRIGRRREAETFLGTLLGVCVLILLAASANAVSFLLGRAAVRAREMAVRAALGASRGRLARQSLADASVISIVAGATAALVAGWVTGMLAPLPRAYLGYISRSEPLTTSAAVDARMFVVTIALAFGASLLVGVLPTLRTFHDPMTAMRGVSGRWGWSRLWPTPRQGVLMLQVGLAVVLAISATLFARGFARAARADAGYAEPDAVLMARLVPMGAAAEDLPSFNQELTEKLEAMPGVVSTAWSATFPFPGGTARASRPDDPDRPIEVGGEAASPRFFETNGVVLRAGREFGRGAEDAEAVIVNEVLADLLWPGEDPVGRSVIINGEARHVIGVVAQTRCRSLLGEPEPCQWRRLDPAYASTIRVRTSGDPMALVPGLRTAVRAASPDMVVVEAESLETFLARLVAPERTSALASSALAILGIALLAVGCAALFTEMVRDSLREFAVRIALGATGRRIAARIVGRGVLLTVAGSAVGLVATWLLAPYFADRLYGVRPTDAVSYVSGLLAVAVAGVGAVAFAALGATRADPARHLHAD